LDIGLALDGPSGPEILDLDEVLAWDLPYAELVQHAVWNLRRLTGPDALIPVDTVPGLWRYAVPDGLASSRVLCLADLLRPWPLEGAVVACPTRDQLLVVPLDGLAALQALHVLVRANARQEGARLSDRVFWVDDDGRWTSLRVRQEGQRLDVEPHPSFVAALERLMAVSLVRVAGEA
jgi:hypothetical protein